MPDLLWVDLETTGLNATLFWSRILEASFVLTDERGTILKSFTKIPTFQRRHLDYIVRDMPPKVREMHTKSGLIDELFEVSFSAAPINKLYEDNDRYESQLREGMIAVAQTLQHKLPMSGASVHFDRRWLAKFAPEIESGFHYRDFDISTIRMSVKFLRPDLAKSEPEKRGIHRTLADIEDAIRYYRWAQENFFVKQEG